MNEINKELLDAATIDGAAIYDLTQIETDEPHFKEPAKQEEPQKKERAKRRPSKPVPPQNAQVFGEQDERTFLEQDEDTHVIQEEPNFESGKVALSDLLPADTLIVVLDKIMSIVLPLGINKLAGTKLKPSDFKLTADEKKTLKPALEAAARTIPINFSNPWVALAFVGVAVYGAKAVGHINFDNLDTETFDYEHEQKQTRKPRAKKASGRDYAAEYAKRQLRKEAK
jgi:hypothetical protein